MAHNTQTFRLSPAVRPLWRRAADELLIAAIFGDLPVPAALPEHAAPPSDDREDATPLLVAAE